MALLGRQRVMHWMSAGSPSLRHIPAQAQPARMQKRSKITVVDKLPDGVEARSIGFHGSTRNSFDSIADMGVDFQRGGQNFSGYSAYGSGLYVTPYRGIAESFAEIAKNRERRYDEYAEPEVAQVLVAKTDDKLMEVNLPPDAEAGNPQIYDNVTRDAHLVNVNQMQSFVTPRGAESEDVNFYVVRNK